jgi:multiple sugar transport system substrate-binding protein
MNNHHLHKSRQSAYIYVFLFVIIMLLSGCTDTVKQPDLPTASIPDASIPETTNDIAQEAQTDTALIELKLEISDTSYYAGHMATYQLVKQQFELKHPHVTVTLINTNEMPNSFETIDLYEAGTDDLLRLESRLTDLKPYIEQDSSITDDFYPSTIDQKMINGKLLALPSYPEPLAIFYSKKWFDQAGIPYPEGQWTWEEHVATALKLKEIAPELGGSYGTSIPFDINWLEPLVFSNGGSLLSPDGSTAKGYLDSPKTVEAIQWVANQINDTQITALYTDQWHNGYQYSNDFPYSTGMSMGYYYKLPEYLRAIGDDLGVAPLPYFENGVPANVMFEWGHGIHKDTAHPDLAWELLKDMYIADSTILQSWANSDLPVSYTGVKDYAQNQNSYRSVFIGEFDVAKRPTTLSNPRWSGHDLKKSFINPQLRQLITSGMDIQKGLSELAVRLDERLSQPIDSKQ